MATLQVPFLAKLNWVWQTSVFVLTGVMPSFASWVLNHIYDISLELRFVCLDELLSDLVGEARIHL